MAEVGKVTPGTGLPPKASVHAQATAELKRLSVRNRHLFGEIRADLQGLVETGAMRCAGAKRGDRGAPQSQ